MNGQGEYPPCQAVIEGEYQTLKDKEPEVTVYDSTTQWIPKWKKDNIINGRKNRESTISK